ncbi:MAG: outer membrane protein assembly factor BamD, partial [Pontibacter sp.]|nr:outer membrane protein assembly factor BamD [Pontibacter sp.]
MTEASQSLYQAGALALKQAQYDEAIAALERFCKETVNRQSKQFFQAQMWLIQAYHKDHQDLHAIALCEQLARSEIPQVKQWADNALNQLMATAEPESDLASTQHAASGSGFVEDTAHPAASAQARNMASPLVSTDSFQQPTR